MKDQIYSIAVYDRVLSEREIAYIDAIHRNHLGFNVPVPTLITKPTFFKKIKLLFELWKLTLT